jgi:hypothetical protein
LNVTMAFAGWAAVAANKYRAKISIVATSVIGTFGFVQVSAGYGIPGMSNFTIGKLMSGGVSCGDGESSCWGSLAAVMGTLVSGTLNQLKMESMDFNMPATTAYEEWLHRVEKSLQLLFAINEFIESGIELSTDDLMERCLKARDDLVKYANIVTNLMHFSLCFGFAADFMKAMSEGVFFAVPWAGVVSAALSISSHRNALPIKSKKLSYRNFCTSWRTDFLCLIDHPLSSNLDQSVASFRLYRSILPCSTCLLVWQ